MPLIGARMQAWSRSQCRFSRSFSGGLDLALLGGLAHLGVLSLHRVGLGRLGKFLTQDRQLALIDWQFGSDQLGPGFAKLCRRLVDLGRRHRLLGDQPSKGRVFTLRFPHVVLGLADVQFAAIACRAKLFCRLIQLRIHCRGVRLELAGKRFEQGLPLCQFFLQGVQRLLSFLDVDVLLFGVQLHRTSPRVTSCPSWNADSHNLAAETGLGCLRRRYWAGRCRGQ